MVVQFTEKSQTGKWGSPVGSDSKESTFNAEDPCWIPRSGIFPWRWEWQPTPVFLTEEFHGQRSPVGYSPWDCKESDTTEQLTLSLFIFLLVQLVLFHAPLIHSGVPFLPRESFSSDTEPRPAGPAQQPCVGAGGRVSGICS